MDDPLSPRPGEIMARARTDLSAGLPVGLCAGSGGLWLAAAVETLTQDRLDALLSLGDGDLAITHWRAGTLKIGLYDGDLVRIGVGTGAHRNALMDLADPSRDLESPMKGPFAVRRGGATAPHRAAIALAKSAHLLPAAILVRVASVPQGITLVDLSQTPEASRPAGIVSARLPMEDAAETRLHVFRDLSEGPEHSAVEVGRVDRSAPVLVRLHSACFTGDVLGSLKCDCGAQLHGALRSMWAAGGGVLCYLNQEGRGIGLVNKMRAYALQEQGFDTVEANHRLGFEDDERDFALGARMLTALRIGRVRLMTNNPRKIAMLEDAGIEVVERVPLWVGRGEDNARYLDTKTDRSGHLR